MATRSRRSRSTLMLFLALSAGSTATLSGQARLWTVEDVMGLRSAGSATVSPDGQWLAYVVSGRDLEENRALTDIWLVEVDGGAPFQLTREGRPVRTPAWAPDGSWLAFLSDRDGRMQVYGIRPRGGEAWKVTDIESGVRSFRISPDGKALAFTVGGEESEESKEREKQRGRPMVWDSAQATDWVHLWTAPLDGLVASEATRSSPDGLSVGSFVWSPDSRSLAWSASGMATRETHPTRDRPTGLSRESNVYVQDRPGAPPRQATSLRGQVSPEAWVEGLGLLVSGTGHDIGTFNRRLWLLPLDGGQEPRALTEDLDENAGFVAASTTQLLVEARHRTGGRLYRIALGNGAPAGDPEAVTDDQLDYGNFSASSDLRRISFVAEGPGVPPNVYVATGDRFSPRRLTDLNPQVRELAAGDQRVVKWRSRADGEEIEGVLTLPVGYRAGQPVPLLLVIHGGPSGVSSNTFNPGGRYPIQVFASMGYASLQPNYRGSTGYGERFRSLNRGHISGTDWVDVDSGVDHLVESGVADPERLGIMGWSFGGHHTFWGITQTNRFKAASAGAGANDLISMYSQTDLPGFYHTYLGPRPWEDFNLYEERSAYRRVAEVRTPLLIQVGEKDERVPAEQSIQFFEAMSGLGNAPVKLVIYPDEGHGISDVALTRDVMLRNVEWFTSWIPVQRTSTQDGTSRDKP